ncbi:hypothetical protein [uncultured Polaribacter sp.]|uniref:hypothetical protein n=1 Tax=uncultured Polaribacter sp. TaxID=174711 RepID=UPI00260DF59C|nr:hypothetical protein [uncultured Polaribacter sp.]
MKNNIENSEEFLKSVLNKSTGFTTPKNYFSETEDRFSMFLMEDKLSNTKSFKTPDNYFDKLEDKILERTFLKKETKVISLKDRLFKYIPITAAASVVLFLSINYFSISTTSNKVNFDAIAQADIENWIFDNSTDLSDEDFVAVLNNEIVNENDFAFTSLENDIIEDYIISSENISLLNEIY